MLLNPIKSINNLKQLNFIRYYHFSTNTAYINGSYRFNPLSVTTAAHPPDRGPACLVDFILSTCISIYMPGKRFLFSLGRRTPISPKLPASFKILIFPAVVKETTLFRILLLLKEYLYFIVKILSKQINTKVTRSSSGTHLIGTLDRSGINHGNSQVDDMCLKSAK